MSGALDDRLIEWTDADATVLTRTRRLARALSVRVAELRADRGRSVATTPDILTLNAWVRREWERTDPDDVVLGDAAETALWETVISNDTRSGPDAVAILDLHGLALRAKEAWQTLTLWGEPDWTRWPSTVETQAFRAWTSSFKTILKERRLVTEGELIGRLAASCGDGTWTPPRSVISVGFGRLDTATERLLAGIRDKSSSVHVYDKSASKPVAPTLRCYATPAQEVIGTAKLVRDELEENPKRRIGVLCADFGTYRQLIDKHFALEIQPKSSVGGKAGPRVFDLAGAPALSEYPLVAHALDLLSLGSAPVVFAKAGRILRAPYPHDDREFDKRAAAEVAIREDNRLELSLSGPRSLISAVARSGAENFAERLRKLAGIKSKSREKRSPQGWCEIFDKRLRAMGWPGSDLSELEGVVFAKWRDVFLELARLELVSPEMSEEQALSRLRQLCQATVVQAPSPGLQIQAMGVLDSVGLEFDSVYALGFSSTAFPSHARPSPLLPVAWQRERRLPFASAEVELELADRLWEGMLRSADRLTVSYASTGEGSERRLPSPHVQGLAVDADRVAECLPWYLEDDDRTANLLEPRPDDTQVPALVLSGGTGLLKDQSACPFSALAARRLRADALEAPTPEPTPLTRGNLVHGVLERAWGKLSTSTALREADADTLAGLVSSAADEALSACVDLPANLRSPLREWLTELCLAWLEFEKQRIGEWRVIGTESDAALELDAGSEGRKLRLERLRIDRIDETPSGDRIIIDYKTGSTEKSYRSWIGQRPGEPQLLIYVLSQLERDREVCASAFANLVSREKLSLNGPPDVELVDAGKGGRRLRHSEWTSWSEELSRCESHLEALAAQYAEGVAPVDPLMSQGVCRFCRRHALCRDFEGIEIEEDEEETADR